MSDCVFCDIISGKIPSYKIYENDFVYAFLDIANDFYGHTLVIPKNHYKDIFEIPQNEYIEVMKVVKKIGEHYKTLGFSGVNILNASGKDAEQSVFHLHFHIIPRKNNDEISIWPKHKNNDFNFLNIQKELKLK